MNYLLSSAAGSYLFWIQVAAVIQILFVFVAAADAGWFHFYKYRLHLRACSKREHLLHTLNSFLFPATIVGVFVVNVGGLFLWAVLMCYLLTFAIELVDVWEEKSSRAIDGGLEPLESVLHFGMGVLRGTVLGLFLASKNFEEFKIGAQPFLLEIQPPGWVQMMGFCMLVTSVPLAAIHLFTYLRPPQRGLLA